MEPLQYPSYAAASFEQYFLFSIAQLNSNINVNMKMIAKSSFALGNFQESKRKNNSHKGLPYKS
jgi:hypothetical protein